MGSKQAQRILYSSVWREEAMKGKDGWANVSGSCDFGLQTTIWCSAVPARHWNKVFQCQNRDEVQLSVLLKYGLWSCVLTKD